MHAVRNIRLCTKDCLCLYVCPTGASDTETGQVDPSKCIGCGACVKSCPSHALSMAPDEYPPQQPKTPQVKNAMLALAKSKTQQEKLALSLAQSAKNPVEKQLAEAMEKSNRIMAEDIIREAGFMIAQSGNSYDFLKGLLAEKQEDDFPIDAVKELLSLLKFNEKPTEKPADTLGEEKWRCTICGHIHEGALPTDFVCPICGQPPSMFEKI
ncbi:MAG: 4Fe-4S dicluster domain-containing protein [Oscillospiraceae bacterium]